MPAACTSKGSGDYKYSLKTYGPQSKFGFKDYDNLWKAEHWDPDKLMALYKRAGAHYFMALANHHDNFDCYDSKYQPWNSTKVGPMKDIVGIWAEVAQKERPAFRRQQSFLPRVALVSGGLRL